MSGTALHAALVALTAGFQGIGIAGLSVSDGPDWEPGTLALEVGWSPVNGESVTVIRRLNNAGGSSHEETFAIDCLLSVHDGSMTIAAARAVLVGVFNQLEAWIASTPSLDDAVALGHIGELGYLPDREESSADAELRFTVTATALG